MNQVRSKSVMGASKLRGSCQGWSKERTPRLSCGKESEREQPPVTPEAETTVWGGNKHILLSSGRCCKIRGKSEVGVYLLPDLEKNELLLLSENVCHEGDGSRSAFFSVSGSRYTPASPTSMVDSSIHAAK